MSSVHLSVLDIQFDIFQFLGKRAKVVTATVKIFIRLHDEWSMQHTLEEVANELSEQITLFWVKRLTIIYFDSNVFLNIVIPFVQVQHVITGLSV